MTEQNVRSTAVGLVTPRSWLRGNEFQLSEDASEHPLPTIQGTELPADFPRSVEDLMCWSGISFDHDDLHVLQLNRKKVREIEMALLSFLGE